MFSKGGLIMVPEILKKDAKILELLKPALGYVTEQYVKPETQGKIPRYSVLELLGHVLGQMVSQQVQAWVAAEVAASAPQSCPCPECGVACPVGVGKRQLQSMDGLVTIQGAQAFCPRCRRTFFPSSPRDGAG